ncbi:MAG: hypothetical protein V3W41_00735 [Planctomycetota bacterium]
MTATALLHAAGISAAQSFKPGKLHPAVSCAADPSQSYALYLPPGYNKDRQWPILYGFSPGANGRHVVELHREAAKRFGWIVVGSNNSRNGPFEVIKRAADAMWKDTRKRLSIDNKRLYATGFSGGGSVSSWFAQNHSLPFAGVFMHARGAIGGIPRKKTSTFFMLLPGITSDFNFDESVRFLCLTRRTGTRAHLDAQRGGHDWAPKSSCHAMLRYAELMARLDATSPPDRKLAKLVDEEAAMLEDRLKGPLFLCAWERLEELAARVHKKHKFSSRFSKLAKKMKRRLESESLAWADLDEGCLFDAKIKERYPSIESLNSADRSRRKLANDYPGTTATHLAIASQVLAPRSLERVNSNAVQPEVHQAYAAYLAKVKSMSVDFVDQAKKLIKNKQLHQAVVALHHGVLLETVSSATLKKKTFRKLAKLPSFRRLKKALSTQN